MKILLNSTLKETSQKIILEKEYFCILDHSTLLGIKKECDNIDKPLYTPPSDPPFITPVYIEEEEPVASQPRSDKKNFLKQDIILVLFVKASAGFNLLKQIKEQGALSPECADELYLHTMNLWVGDQSSFDKYIYPDFNMIEQHSNIPTLDYVMVQTYLPKKYSGFEKDAKSVDRIRFINEICFDRLPIIKISKRLNFSSKASEYAWEK